MINHPDIGVAPFTETSIFYHALMDHPAKVRPRREVSWRLSERALEVLSSVGAGFLRTALDQTQLRWRKWGANIWLGLDGDNLMW